MPTTPTLALPYPVSADTADVPRDIKALADALDALAIAPAGVIQMWPGGAAPTGWFLLNGQVVPAASNPKLAALFGQAGGNVTLPNLAGRLPLGVDGAHALGTTGGAAAVQLTAAQSGVPAHAHANTIAVAQHPARNHAHGGATLARDRSQSHAHGVGGGSLIYNANVGAAVNVSAGTGMFRSAMGADAADPADHLHGITNDAMPALSHTVSGGVSNNAAGDAASSHENMPPYFAVNFIIRGG